jgi:hypothetical protein
MRPDTRCFEKASISPPANSRGKENVLFCLVINIVCKEKSNGMTSKREQPL